MKKVIKFCSTILMFQALLFISCSKNCSNNSQQKEQNKTVVTIGISQEPDSLFMPFKEMMAAEEVARPAPYTLTVFDENWELIPWAAKSIPTIENGNLELFTENKKQKMRTTWVLRDDFYWPDGAPLIADDFIIAHKIYSDPDLEIVDRSVTEKIEKMESVGKDKKTLVITWKEPYAYYHNYRQHEALPEHIIKPIYKKNAKKLKKHSFGQRPALAGGYTIKKWVAGNYIVAQKNKQNKFFAHSKIDKIIWRIIPQTNTLEANLVSGTIDAISPVGLSLEQALRFEKRYKDEFNFYFTPGLVWEHIDYNLDNKILKDKRVRQALAYGANREGISQSLFAGKQPVAHGTEPPQSQYYNKNIKKYEYNPKKAEELLEQAGWKKVEGEDIREKNGKKLQLIIMTTSGSKTREQIQQLLQSQWRKIGVDIQIKNQPAKVFFGSTLRKRKYPHLAMYAWIKDPLAISDALWRCDYIPRKSNNYMGQNQPGWCNKEADKILKQATLELDDQKRIALGKKFEEIWANDLPALPLFFRVETSVTKKGLKNWKPTGMLQPVSWNAADWYWE